MGLSDRGAAAGMGGDWAAQAQAAQELANQHLQAAGYTDGSPLTMANSAAASDQMYADRDVLTAYGNELNRIIQIGTDGTGVITSVDTGERIAGNPWYQLEVEVTVPGYAPFTVSKHEMVPTMMLHAYTVGTSRPVNIDPADRNNIAFSA